MFRYAQFPGTNFRLITIIKYAETIRNYFCGNGLVGLPE